jgi:hypothetical protein
MEKDQSDGAAPQNPAKTQVMEQQDGSQLPDEQPTTVAGGIVGPLETAIEESVESSDRAGA